MDKSAAKSKYSRCCPWSIASPHPWVSQSAKRCSSFLIALPFVTVTLSSQECAGNVWALPAKTFVTPKPGSIYALITTYPCSAQNDAERQLRSPWNSCIISLSRKKHNGSQTISYITCLENCKWVSLGLWLFLKCLICKWCVYCLAWTHSLVVKKGSRINRGNLHI